MQKIRLNSIIETPNNTLWCAMGTTPDHIKNVLKSKASFETPDINHCVKFLNIHFWEFVLAAIPLEHLSEKAKSKILFCKEVSDQMKKKRK